MRLAGTWSRYSKSAIPQLANAATYHGRDDRLRRWAYQANVMKTFEAMRRETVTRIVRIDADGNAPPAWRRSNGAHGWQITAAATIRYAIASGRRQRDLVLDDIENVRDEAFHPREEPRIGTAGTWRCHRRSRHGQHSSH